MYDKNTLFKNGRICAFPMWGTKYYPLLKSAHRIFFNVSEIYSEHDYPQDGKTWQFNMQSVIVNIYMWLRFYHIQVDMQMKRMRIMHENGEAKYSDTHTVIN